MERRKIFRNSVAGDAIITLLGGETTIVPSCTNVKCVNQVSDFGTPSGGVISITENTTFCLCRPITIEPSDFTNFNVGSNVEFSIVSGNPNASVLTNNNTVPLIQANAISNSYFYLDRVSFMMDPSASVFGIVTLDNSNCHVYVNYSKFTGGSLGSLNGIWKTVIESNFLSVNEGMVFNNCLETIVKANLCQVITNNNQDHFTFLLDGSVVNPPAAGSFYVFRDTAILTLSTQFAFNVDPRLINNVANGKVEFDDVRLENINPAGGSFRTGSSGRFHDVTSAAPFVELYAPAHGRTTGDLVLISDSDPTFNIGYTVTATPDADHFRVVGTVPTIKNGKWKSGSLDQTDKIFSVKDSTGMSMSVKEDTYFANDNGTVTVLPGGQVWTDLNVASQNLVVTAYQDIGGGQTQITVMAAGGPFVEDSPITIGGTLAIDGKFPAKNTGAMTWLIDYTNGTNLAVAGTLSYAGIYPGNYNRYSRLSNATTGEIVITDPAGFSGIAKVRIGGTQTVSGTGIKGVRLVVNGNPLDPQSVLFIAAGTVASRYVTIESPVTLSAGDTVRVQINDYANVAGNFELESYAMFLMPNP